MTFLQCYSIGKTHSIKLNLISSEINPDIQNQLSVPKGEYHAGCGPGDAGPNGLAVN